MFTLQHTIFFFTQLCFYALFSSTQTVVYNGMLSCVWCAVTPVACIDSCTCLGYVETLVLSQTHLFNISAWSHKYSNDWMSTNTHRYIPKSCRKNSQMSGGSYSWVWFNFILMAMVLEWDTQELSSDGQVSIYLWPYRVAKIRADSPNSQVIFFSAHKYNAQFKCRSHCSLFFVMQHYIGRTKPVYQKGF